MLTHENYLEQCRALTAWYPFWPGVRYLSILPTNHAIDFMVGFIGPFVCGACVVHLRTLRPEFVRDAFARYRITYVALVPMIVKNLERGLRAKFDDLPAWKRAFLNLMISTNVLLTRRRPRVKLSRMLLPGVHRAFGGELLALITGGAFMEPSTMQFFYDLGIPVVNGYGLTEAGTALTLNDLRPFRADTVGKPLPGVDLRILNPDAEGVGEVAVSSKTVMSHYLDDPELTLETIVEGWLLTGDLGRLNSDGHLQLFGRKKNMIVTEGGKNIYPEDIETVFDGLPVKEYSVFAANYIWPKKELGRESSGAGVAAGAESEIRQPAAGRNLGAEPALARFQACERISGMGQRFSPYRFDENQAPGTGGRDRIVNGARNGSKSVGARWRLCRADWFAPSRHFGGPSLLSVRGIWILEARLPCNCESGSGGRA